MKKILYLSTALTFGGAETQLTRIAGLLKSRGWEVKIVSMTPPSAYAEELKAQGVSVETLNMQKGKIEVNAFFRFVKILRSEKPDILNTFLVHANFFGRLSRLFVRIPVLVSSARNVFEGGGIRNWWYRLTDFLCDITTQVSQAGLQRYVDEKLVPVSKIAYIPNGIDTKRFKKNDADRLRLRRELGLENVFVWLAVGRLEEAKDYPNMINAFNLISKNSQQVLLIVGEGLLSQKIKEQVQKSDLDKVIKFLGIRTDIADLMSASDAYVMSSAWEGMANVLLEAAACSLPIVTTNVGGNTEVVLAGETGFLVLPRDARALADAMLAVMKLPVEKRLEMGRAGRKYVEETYGLERIVDKWEELYSRLISKK